VTERCMILWVLISSVFFEHRASEYLPLLCLSKLCKFVNLAEILQHQLFQLAVRLNTCLLNNNVYNYISF